MNSPGCSSTCSKNFLLCAKAPGTPLPPRLVSGSKGLSVLLEGPLSTLLHVVPHLLSDTEPQAVTRRKVLGLGVVLTAEV